MPDATLEKLDGRPLTVIRKDWKSETDVRNGIQETAFRLGYRACLMLDADEVLADFDETIKQIQEAPFHSAYTCNLVDFGPDGEKLAPRSHKPVIALDTRMINGMFTDKRCVSATLKQLTVDLNHYSYDVPSEYKYKTNKKDGDDWPPQEHKGVIHGRRTRNNRKQR